jgi:hypothetical protein
LNLKENSIERAATLIRELGIDKLSVVENYERCETISRLAPKEVVDLIQEQHLKRGVIWLKKAHENIPSVAEWRREFARTIKLLFDKAGGPQRVKSWHELEAVCDKISEKELKKVDEDLRQAIMWVKHIHDDSRKMILEVMGMIRTPSPASDLNLKVKSNIETYKNEP